MTKSKEARVTLPTVKEEPLNGDFDLIDEGEIFNIIGRIRSDVDNDELNDFLEANPILIDQPHPISRYSPLEWAIKGRNIAAAYKILEWAQDNDVERIVNEINLSSGKTPLHGAAISGNLPMCRLLLNFGADPMIKKPNKQMIKKPNKQTKQTGGVSDGAKEDVLKGTALYEVKKIIVGIRNGQVKLSEYALQKYQELYDYLDDEMSERDPNHKKTVRFIFGGGGESAPRPAVGTVSEAKSTRLDEQKDRGKGSS